MRCVDTRYHYHLIFVFDKTFFVVINIADR